MTSIQVEIPTSRGKLIISNPGFSPCCVMKFILTDEYEAIVEAVVDPAKIRELMSGCQSILDTMKANSCLDE